MNFHPKINNTIEEMLSDMVIKLQFYGEFCQFINFVEDNSIPTCGVNVEVDGMTCYYNSNFFNRISQTESNFIIIHEILHLLWDHQSRIRKCGYEQNLSNVVQDMIINHIIIRDIIGRLKKDKKVSTIFAEVPRNKDGEIYVYTLPPEYKGQLIFEELYDWMIEQKEKYEKWRKIEREINICPVSDYVQKIFDNIEFEKPILIDVHMESELPEEYRKDIIENVKNELNNRGLVTEDIDYILKKLKKSRKDYTKAIKLASNELFGTYKEKSITRKNRRSIPGLKGNRKDSFALNVLCDTSSSMYGYFEKTLSYIFQNDIMINFVQIDTEVKKIDVVKNKYQINKLKIKGLGGTKLSPGIRYIIEDKKLKKLNLLILTDGVTDILDFKNFNKKCLILSIGKKCEIKNINPKKIKQIIIKN